MFISGGGLIFVERCIYVATQRRLGSTIIPCSLKVGTLVASFLFKEAAFSIRESVVVDEITALGSKFQPRRGRFRDLGFRESSRSLVNEAVGSAGLASKVGWTGRLHFLAMCGGRCACRVRSNM